MPTEFDLPCSACGGELREVTIESNKLAVQVGGDASVLVADCRSCGERHYPEQTLTALESDASPNA